MLAFCKISICADYISSPRSDVIANVSYNFFNTSLNILYLDVLVTLAPIFVIVFQFEPAHGIRPELARTRGFYLLSPLARSLHGTLISINKPCYVVVENSCWVRFYATHYSTNVIHKDLLFTIFCPCDLHLQLINHLSVTIGGRIEEF